jgi:hypothetical protein
MLQFQIMILLKIGTLSAILTDVAAARNQTKEELINQIFG